MSNLPNIKVLYINDWLQGSWQVQKIHAEEFLHAFQRQPGIQVFAFPQIPTLKNENTYDKREKQFVGLTKQFIKKVISSFPKWTLNEMSYRRNIVEVKRYINKIQPDLIIARHTAVFFPIIHRLTKLKQPLILEVNALVKHDLEVAKIKVSSRISRLERDIIRLADALFSVCNATSEMIKEMGVDPGKVFTVPNGVDPTKFSPQPKSVELCTKYGLANNIVVGYVGGFAKGEPDGRDVIGMLEAFKIAQSKSECLLKMLMVGKMDYEYLREEIRRIGITDSVVFNEVEQIIKNIV